MIKPQKLKSAFESLRVKYQAWCKWIGVSAQSLMRAMCFCSRHIRPQADLDADATHLEHLKLRDALNVLRLIWHQVKNVV
jgi:hypothetical protein